MFLTRGNTLLEEHASNHKLSKKEISLKASYYIQGLMRELYRLFKGYCNENNHTIKVAKNSKYKNTRNIIIFKVKQSKKEYQNYLQKLSKNTKKPRMASNQL